MGKVRLIQNFSGEKVEPKCIGNIDIEVGVRYLHFHDFQDNFALIGSMAGDLFGFKSEHLTSGNLSNSPALQAINEDFKLMYETFHSITNIRTARVKDSPEEFFITLSDVIGFVHLLKG